MSELNNAGSFGVEDIGNISGLASEIDVLYFQVQEIVESVISPSILGPPYISDTVT